MKELVTKNLTTTSLMLAEQFGRSHKSILRTIENIIFDMDENELARRKIVPSSYLNEQNKEQKMYELGEEMSLVVTGRLTGKEALIKQLKLADAFIAMRNFISNGTNAQLQAAQKKLAGSIPLDPDCIKSVFPGLSNKQLHDDVYGACVTLGLLTMAVRYLPKYDYAITDEGWQYFIGFSKDGIVRLRPDMHDALIAVITQALKAGQTDWTI